VRGRPPRQATTGKPLLTEPKSLTIIDQSLYRIEGTVGEHKNCAAKGILFQDLATEGNEGIYAFAEVSRFYGQQ
jgi:hypothetical protein